MGPARGKTPGSHPCKFFRFFRRRRRGGGHLGKTITWKGEGLDEKGYDSESGNLIIEVDSRYFRPTEVETLLGDPSKAKQELGWEPKITLEDMVHEMMENDINIAKRDSLIKDHGYKVSDFNE